MTSCYSQRPRAGICQVGAATNLIPARSGLPLAGYIEREAVSEGIHDALEISAVAVSDGADQAVFVGADLLAVDADMVADVAERTGVKPGSLLLAASHTHSAPAGAALNPASKARLDVRYRHQVIETIASTVTASVGNLQPALACIARQEIRNVAAHRNQIDRPVDHRVTRVAFSRPTGDVIAEIVHFPCHPTVLGPQNLLISADFPWALRRAIRAQRHADDLTVLYLNGAAADVSTRYTRHRQDFAEVERIGRTLARVPEHGAWHEVLGQSGRVRTVSSTICLPGKPRETIDAARQRVSRCELELGDATSNGENLPAVRRLRTKLQGAQAQLARSHGYGLMAAPVTVCAIRVGDLAVVGISAEIATAIGAAIEKEIPALSTIIVGLANGYNGYITDSYGAEASYESLTSPFQAIAGGQLSRETVALLQELL